VLYFISSKQERQQRRLCDFVQQQVWKLQRRENSNVKLELRIIKSNKVHC